MTIRKGALERKAKQPGKTVVQGNRASEGPVELLRTAERLFGQHGIDGVSDRQIILAAGQSNNSAIKHHFGSKTELLHAVCDMRIHELEAAHKRRLAAAEKAGYGPLGVRELLEALLLPLSEDIGDDGSANFARFLSRLVHLSPDEHPMYRDSRRLKTAKEIDSRLKALLAFLPEELFFFRYRLVVSMFLFGVAERARMIEGVASCTRSRRSISEDLINIATAALSAPLDSDSNATSSHAKSAQREVPVRPASSRARAKKAVLF